MTLQDAVNIRCSRRKYLSNPIESLCVAKLKALITEYQDHGGLDIRLVLENGVAFNGFRKSYGMFSGVRNYIGLIGDKSDLVNTEKLGYYGELLVLHATILGLGTCWVGGSFHRESCPFDLHKSESIICAIAVGHVPHNLGMRENFIRKITHRKTKSIEQMYKSTNIVPEWFISGIKSVQMAPSAVNRQPVTFSYTGGNAVTASVKDITGDCYALDLGIAKLHFELGADGGTWGFGNGAEFNKGI